MVLILSEISWLIVCFPVINSLFWIGQATPTKIATRCDQICYWIFNNYELPNELWAFL